MSKPDFKAKPLTQSQSRAPKRPDQPFYTPRAARERLPPQESQGSPANKDLKSSAQCKKKPVSSPSDPCSCPEATEERVYPISSVQEACAVDSVTGVLDSESWLCPQEKTKKSVLRLEESETIVWDELQSSFAKVKLEDAKGEDFNHVQTEETSTDADDVTEQVRYGWSLHQGLCSYFLISSNTFF